MNSSSSGSGSNNRGPNNRSSNFRSGYNSNKTGTSSVNPVTSSGSSAAAGASSTSPNTGSPTTGSNTNTGGYRGSRPASGNQGGYSSNPRPNNYQQGGYGSRPASGSYGSSAPATGATGTNTTGTNPPAAGTTTAGSSSAGGSAAGGTFNRRPPGAGGYNPNYNRSSSPGGAGRSFGGGGNSYQKREFGSRRDGPPEAHRINSRISAREVRVVSESGEQLGVLTTLQALEIAQRDGFDLVEVAPQANPPVCKIMDYGKFKYREQKKEAEAKKKRTESTLKELRIRYRTDSGDLETKLKQARDFFEDGDKVKFSMRFKGREAAFIDLGVKKFDQIIQRLADIASVDERSPAYGKQIHITFAPLKAATPVKPKKPSASSAQAGGAQKSESKASQSKPAAVASVEDASPSANEETKVNGNISESIPEETRSETAPAAAEDQSTQE